ncbi:MAG: trehalose-6-phosphate synthase [Elusimicrobia bacterium]|nr:trehalose-6-phosphate synthase [Elusimicrobiota bacterium]
MRLSLRLFLSFAGAAAVAAAGSHWLQPDSPTQRLAVEVVLFAGAAVWLVRSNVLGPMDQMAAWIKAVRVGSSAPPAPVAAGLLGPLANEVSRLGSSLAAAKATAEEETRLRVNAAALWTPQRLKEEMRRVLDGRPLVVVANREPYMHVRRGREIEVVTPASGLVTALEPVLLACGGTWVAHGGGDADRDTVDADDRLQVPPDNPKYALRRVWLTKEEEDGYYYGFSNEGLWALCHIAHNRPSFLPEDWAHYQAVNAKFAQALLEEIKDAREPCVLIQDYHYALLPRLIKEARPDARVGVFWHIPWPNPEAFGICPWQREILDGMLGADVLGFHVQAHCNNFLETVDGALESRIDWERFAVQRLGRTTLVRPFPISVDVPEPGTLGPKPDRAVVLKEVGSRAEFLAVGVDRVDYTKGIVERFRAVERFLERNPSYIGRFTLVQIGAPSRVQIKRYGDLNVELEAEAVRINARFTAGGWKAIVLRRRHHSHEEIRPFLRTADLCMVTSLHDGMNLVAKEYVASRDADDGALILSRFTGAARELTDALLVNPYDLDQTADAIHYALEIAPAERARRMAAMRKTVREHNVYEWAGKLISELARVKVRDAGNVHSLV